MLVEKLDHHSRFHALFTPSGPIFPVLFAHSLGQTAHLEKIELFSLFFLVL